MLLKKLLLFLFAAFTLVCCTSQNEREVVLFNDIAFELQDGEEIIKIDTETKEDFHSYFKNTDVQIPLFRCIKADNYLIYLGIPINASINKLAEAKLKGIKEYHSLERDSTSYFYISYQQDVEAITDYAKVFDDNFIYILTVSDSMELSDSLFSRSTLSGRLNQQ